MLSFWAAYVLTRPLGANLGDWFASATTDHGLGLGYGVTSVIFLVTIAGAVAYLTITHVDVIDGTVVQPESSRSVAVTLGYYAVVVLAAGALLSWANSQPHQAVVADDEAPAAAVTLKPGRPVRRSRAADVAHFRTITADTLAKVNAGDQAGAKARATDLETAWDNNQSTLQSAAPEAWEALDQQIDAVLKAVR